LNGRNEFALSPTVRSRTTASDMRLGGEDRLVAPPKQRVARLRFGFLQVDTGSS